jgi:hypothetical protein
MHFRHNGFETPGGPIRRNAMLRGRNRANRWTMNCPDKGPRLCAGTNRVKMQFPEGQTAAFRRVPDVRIPQRELCQMIFKTAPSLIGMDRSSGAIAAVCLPIAHRKAHSWTARGPCPGPLRMTAKIPKQISTLPWASRSGSLSSTVRLISGIWLYDHGKFLSSNRADRPGAICPMTSAIEQSFPPLQPQEA